ncbi:atrial natriuretic peptide receptor 1-like [Diadema antillarum]|uniref:atrial natriuretic peptide receptor 1-like n=1 Tax=Diadema antillarum TaxID=105358 RepID=UPI003A83B695
MEDVMRVMADPPYHLDVTQPAIMSAYLYDALLLYAHAVNVTMESGDSLLDGFSIGSLMQGNISFNGMTGMVNIDEFGSRLSDFSILDLQNDTEFSEVGYINGTSYEVRLHTAIDWPGDSKPPDTPKCGFEGEFCFARGIIAAIVLAVVLTLGICIIIPVARIKYKKFVKGSDWMINRADITFIPIRESGGVFPSNYRLQNLSNALSKPSLLSNISTTKNADGSKTAQNHTFATFNSQTVVLRKVKVQNFNLNKAMKRELKEMRWLVQDNINRFLGLCFPSTSGDMFYHVTEYSPKGSLHSILNNDDFNLDLSFKASFIRDLARGMQFLHASEIKSHGILSSATCFVDGRWVLKVSGFGLLSFNILKEDVMKQKDAEVKFSKMLWTAPELLRQELLPSKGSQKGDVYSFGIILQEIVTRSAPYYLSGYTSREIIRRVIRRDEPPCRPKINEEEFMNSSEMSTIFTEINELMKSCWEELPEDRPDFTTIRNKLRVIQRGRKELDILDNMLSKMEKYTENLEKVVADRTGQLLEEKKKTDALLYRMLPQVVAEELKKGHSFPGEFFDHVTIYFSDIVGFTDLSSQSTPMQVVDLLNDLYTCFDAILERFDVYKVETIGDAYMVVSGLPQRNGNRHAGEIACVALELLVGVKKFRIRHRPDHQLQIRIGINTGPVAAGVVGLTMPRFCLFGDTVNTASRMESNSLPQKIHISLTTASLLRELGGYVMEKRGQIEIKGKGEMTTFWLIGKDNQVSIQRESSSEQRTLGKKISTDTVISQDSLLSPSHRMSETAFDIPENRLMEESLESSDLPIRPSTVPETGSMPRNHSSQSTDIHQPHTEDDHVTNSKPATGGRSRSKTPQSGSGTHLNVKDYASLRQNARLGGEDVEISSTQGPLAITNDTRVRSPFVQDEESAPPDDGREVYENPLMDPRGAVMEEELSGYSEPITSPSTPTTSSVMEMENRWLPSRQTSAIKENNNYQSPSRNTKVHSNITVNTSNFSKT